MNESQWFIRRNNDVQGPLSLQELGRLVQQGLIKPGTPVSSDKSAWHDAASIAGLFSRQAGPAHGTSRPIAKELLKSGKSQVSAVVSDLRQMDLQSEINPIDSSNLPVLVGDFAFWGVTLLGVVPLVINAVNPELQLTCFNLFFAALWAVIFKHFVLKNDAPWRLPVISLFFTGLLAIPVLLFIYGHLPEWYVKLPESNNHLVSLFG